MTTNQKELIMVVNEDRFFLSHRKEIALSAQKAGWNVKIVCKNTGQKNEVEDLGLQMIELPINPTGTNIVQELRTFSFLYRLYRQHPGAIVHHVGLKSMLWGLLAARLAKIRGTVNAVSGLGVMFSETETSPLAKAILALLRFALSKQNAKVIFQNHEDQQLFVRKHIIRPSQAVFIKGSGVDLNQFPCTPQPEGPMVNILFTARMVKEKGVLVLAAAAEQLRRDYEGKAQFWLCGGLSSNPKALKEAELQQLCDNKYIKWLGFRKDVKALLMQSHIMAFPSYYREGVPKSLIEACAIGRPIVTTDSIGCRDTVDNGKNGFLVPVKDSKTLAAKLKLLIDNKELRETMGRNSRQKAEQQFSIDKVVEKHLETYDSLLT